MCRDNKVSSPATGETVRPNAWEWHCGMCTLINRPSQDACEICGFPRATRSSVEATEHGTAKDRPSTGSSKDASVQSPGQQILASLRQKADAPTVQQHGRHFLRQEVVDASVSPVRNARCEILAALRVDVPVSPVRDAACEILAALRSGGAQAQMGRHCPTLDPSRELLATLKSGGVKKAGPDLSLQNLDVIKNRGTEQHDGGWFKPKRKAARRGRRGAYGEGNAPMYSQAASGA